MGREETARKRSVRSLNRFSIAIVRNQPNSLGAGPAFSTTGREVVSHSEGAELGSRHYALEGARNRLAFAAAGSGEDVRTS
jgi:hypothetical protein